METQETRAKIVAAALSITANTAIAPGHYELQLLEKYTHGALTIDEVIALLAEDELARSRQAASAAGSRQLLLR